MPKTKILRSLFSAAFVLASLGLSAVAGAYSMSDEAIMDRIMPVGQVSVGEASSASAGSSAASSGPADGGSVYQSTCFACHGTGAAGAPKFGDKAAWAPRIKQGMDTLFSHALNGFKGMPPKGGQPGLSEDALKAAIKHMVDNSK